MVRPRVPRSVPARVSAWVLGVVCACCYPLDGFAEGSCTWEEARSILEQSPELLAHVEQTLVVEPSGFALRLGDHYTDLSGHRVAPFTFQAASKAAPSVRLELVLEAELTFFDHEGRPVSGAESQRAHQVRQTLSGIALRPLAAAPAPEENPGALAQRTAWIREQNAAIQAAMAKATTLPFPPNGPFSGEARFLRDPSARNALRAIEVRATPAGEGQPAFEEHYAFANGELFFLRRRETSWIMHPESAGTRIQRVVETGYYFQDGAIYQALEKRFQAGDPALLDRQAQTAQEQRVALSGTETMQFLSKASRLSLATSPGAVLQVYAAGQ